ncbi:hypothetical protein HC928_02685 [bacterium]|nr:hypothetical protein [bacterium]
MTENLRPRWVARMKKCFSPLLDELIFGIECGSGWDDLVQELITEIYKLGQKEGLDCRIVQIKEKYGELRCYMDGGTDEMYALIEDFTAHSKTVCEVCGGPGKWGSSESGWYRTICDHCKVQL